MTVKLLPETRVSRMPDAVWREIDGRTVVISLEDGRIRTLNATAATLWSSLDGKTLQELVTLLQAVFPARQAEQLMGDVESFVTELLSRGLARIDDVR